MIYFLIGILVGALIEEGYPFIGKLYRWVKSKFN